MLCNCPTYEHIESSSAKFHVCRRQCRQNNTGCIHLRIGAAGCHEYLQLLPLQFGASDLLDPPFLSAGKRRRNVPKRRACSAGRCTRSWSSTCRQVTLGWNSILNPQDPILQDTSQCVVPIEVFGDCRLPFRLGAVVMPDWTESLREQIEASTDGG